MKLWGYRLVGGLSLLGLMCGGLLAGCFASEVQEGLACSASGSCPFGQVCIESVCQAAGGGDESVDAGSNLVAPDAFVADADTSCKDDTVQCGDECLAVCQTEISLPGETSYSPETGCTYLTVHAWGAGGGHGNQTTNGGAGGYARLGRAVAASDSFTIMVGAPGTSANAGTAGTGGLPGGGNGGTGSSDGGGGGGGYSGVFDGAVSVPNAVVIAGAGGGSGGGSGNLNNTHAGAGGGLTGQVGSTEVNIQGGTQTTGFAPLLGGPGGNDTDGGGGGGGGWYGGMPGDGVGGDDAQGAGGGSGYVGTALDAELEAGVRGVAGMSASPLRGTAGDPTLAGKVVLQCAGLPPVQ